MASVLIELAEAADESAQDQHQLARKARTMDRQRQRGWSWLQILDRDREPGLLVLLARSVQRIVQTGSRARNALALGLNDEGQSHRQIAQRFGVSHQRISNMIRRTGP